MSFGPKGAVAVMLVAWSVGLTAVLDLERFRDPDVSKRALERFRDDDESLLLIGGLASRSSGLLLA